MKNIYDLVYAYGMAELDVGLYSHSDNIEKKEEVQIASNIATAELFHTLIELMTELEVTKNKLAQAEEELEMLEEVE